MKGVLHLTLEQQRHQLLLLIERNQPQGSDRNKVTVVFDGSIEVYGSFDQRQSCVKSIFSYNESADDKIKTLVAESRHAGNIVVVTDDRAVQYAVRSGGAKVMSVKKFLHRCEGSQKNASQSNRSHDGGDQKKISQVMKHQINDEMKNIWLQEKKNKD